MIKGLFTRRNVLIALAVLAIIFGGSRVYSSSRRPAYETVAVKRDTVTQRVLASGEIESDQEVKLTFPVTGRIVNLAVKKNDVVKKGDYIASLDKNTLQKNLESALNSYLTNRWTFEQTKDNYNGQVVTTAIQRLLDQSQFSLNNAVITVQLADLAKQLADLYSPIDGVVTSVTTQAGTSEVAATTPIVTIANPDKVFFVANVGEADISDVEMGQETTVTLDAFENKTFHGKVTEIDSAATVTNGGKTYQVKIALDDLERVKLDMSGDAEITTASHANVLVLPRFAIQGSSDKPYVEIPEGKGIAKKDVAIGIKGSGGMVEVLSGISEGERIILPNPGK